MGDDLYAIQPMPCQKKATMFVGIDMITLGGNQVMGLSASYNSEGTKYYTKLGYSGLKKH